VSLLISSCVSSKRRVAKDCRNVTVKNIRSGQVEMGSIRIISGVGLTECEVEHLSSVTSLELLLDGIVREYVA